MTRPTSLLIALVVLALGAAPAAVADATEPEPDPPSEEPDPSSEEPERVYRDGDDGYRAGGGTGGDDGDGDAGGDGDGGGDEGHTTEPVDDTGPREGYYSVGTREGEDGERCWRVRWWDSPGYEPSEDSWDYEEAVEVGEETFGDAYDRCPDDEAAPDPTGAVHAMWTAAALLPDNDLHVAPGWAMTGMPAYLEVQGERTFEHRTDLPAPFSMAVTFEGSAEYEVDWGDGTVTGPHATAGGPHPEGDIVHTYADTTQTEVVVTATWTGVWSVGEHRGELPPIERRHELPLEVRELQSVRTSKR
jgi:hypothetical protein